MSGAAAWLGLCSCSGAAFTATTGSGGTGGDTPKAGTDAGGENDAGTGNGATGGSGAGTAGDTSTGGVVVPPGGSSSTGGGGTGGVTPGCDCGAGQYCREGSTDCFKCAELSRLRFTTPERLAAVSDNGVGSRFPRTGSTSTDLLYRFEGVGVRYTADASTSAGTVVKMTLPQDSGALLLHEEVTSVSGTMNLMSFNFVFDRLMQGARRQLFIGEWKNGLQTIEQAPAPYNGAKNDFSIAIAHHATADNIPRAFWMTDRDVAIAPDGPVLVTAKLVASSPPVPVTIQLGDGSCMPKDVAGKVEQNLTPWVTDDGKTLLLSTTRLDAACAVTGQGKDIYTSLLQPTTGQPTAAAVPLSDVNGAANDIDPAFSADMCDLYFSSDRDGKYALYRAHRK